MEDVLGKTRRAILKAILATPVEEDRKPDGKTRVKEIWNVWG